MNDNELKHYGVLGMKWGKRKRADMESKQQEMIRKRQVGTNKYVKLSNKLYLDKKKEQLRIAKKNKDTVRIQTLKYDIKSAKAGKKYGSNVLDGDEFKSIYKVKRTSKEGAAISLTSNGKALQKDRVKNTLKAIGYVGITAAATAPAWIPMVEQGANFVKKVDLKTVKYNFRTGTLTGINKR